MEKPQQTPSYSSETHPQPRPNAGAYLSPQPAPAYGNQVNLRPQPTLHPVRPYYIRSAAQPNMVPVAAQSPNAEEITVDQITIDADGTIRRSSPTSPNSIRGIAEGLYNRFSRISSAIGNRALKAHKRTESQQSNQERRPTPLNSEIPQANGRQPVPPRVQSEPLDARQLPNGFKGVPHSSHDNSEYFAGYQSLPTEQVPAEFRATLPNSPSPYPGVLNPNPRH